MKKLYISFLLLLLTFVVKSQSLERKVVASGGATSTSGGITLSFTIGEAIINTASFSGYTLTQGFQQPSIVSVGYDSLDIEVTTKDASCGFAADGMAVVKVTDANGQAPYTTEWSLVGTSDDTLNNLLPGDYTVKVTDATGRVGFKAFPVSQTKVECDLVFYSGITPNGDGNNDIFVIDGILSYPDNDVRIFNRWGELVWMNKGYNNTTIVWNGDNERGKPLSDGTYYYLVTIPGNVFKHWVELTR